MWYSKGYGNDAGWYKTASGAVGPPTLTWITAAGLTDAGASKTFTGTAIGTASATRIIFAIVIAAGSAGTTATSLTFTPNAGSPVTATLVAGNSGSTTPFAAIYQAVVPTGTTMDSNLLFPSNPFNNFQMSLWSSDTSQMSSTTATSTFNSLGAGNTTVTATLSASAGGFIITGGGSSNTTSNSTVWSGGETYTKRFDSTINGEHNSFADASGITGNASDTAIATFAQTGSIGVIAAAWR